MNKATRELINAAKEAAEWMKEATPPNEVNDSLRRLDRAIELADKEDTSASRAGSLVLLELGDGRRRVTATVETGDKYLSRSGISAIGVEAEVLFSIEVNDLEKAREILRETLSGEQWAGHGMTWCELPKTDLVKAIKAVATEVNGK